MDPIESMELSLRFTLGIMTFVYGMYALCTTCSGDVLELARLMLP